ncbi:hypothetical protein ACNSOP_01120 [Aliarcobacter lanthieri]|uniref:hypothetical protein n=1 Tax=Aliarcobacter lanthieri TaxID=1355374 RepID=UPI003AA82A1F
MSDFIDCPDCNNKILSRLGTICPSCGFTVGYFNGDKRRKSYGRLFAFNVFTPFLVFFTIIFSQINIYSFILAILFAIFMAFKSCPIYFKDIFTSNFEKALFWGIWIVFNSLLIVLIANISYKSI